MLKYKSHSSSFIYNYIKTLLKHNTVRNNAINYSLYKLFHVVANYVATVYTVQITHNLNGRRMCTACAKAKNTRGIKPCVYTHVHLCKTNAPHTCTYPYEVSVMQRS